MNEEPEYYQDEPRYDELFENSHNDLVIKVMELENIVTDNDDDMQKVYAANESLLKQNDAMREEIRSWNRRGKGRPPQQTGENIGDMRYYFERYEHSSKETVLIQLMKTEALLFESGIIRSAQ